MSDKIYAETQGMPAFDWSRFLDRAERDELADEEIGHAWELSSSWIACACGNQCSIIPRDKDGKPLDPRLAGYGYSFYKSIENGNWAEAREALELVEARSAILIEEELKKLAQK